jgi:hypothetical protein
MPSNRPTIVSRKLLAIDANGREFEVTIAIGAPYEVAEAEWACPASMEGLHRLRDVRGIDSWQAMQLAHQLIAMVLSSFVEDGGRLKWLDELISPDQLFPRTGGPEVTLPDVR